MSYEDDPTKPSTGLWKNEEGKPAGYGGKITITEPGDYFVNLYKNDRKEPGSKQPDLNLRLKKMDRQGAPTRQEVQPSAFVDDAIPF
ncbi:MAG: hypothetical protein M3Q51_00390 [Pseudomonadota bacterium]|nr:hypothetical protein [Pseudomonadota bacterium]